MHGKLSPTGNGAVAGPCVLSIRIDLAGVTPALLAALHRLAPDTVDCLECRLSLRERAFFPGAKDDTVDCLECRLSLRERASYRGAKDVTVADLSAAAGAESDEYTYRGPDHPDFTLTCIKPWDGKLPHSRRDFTTESALIDAIRQAPDDARLAARFALWLEENDDPRGEHIRVQLAMEDYPPGAERWDEDYQALLKRDCGAPAFLPVGQTAGDAASQR